MAADQSERAVRDSGRVVMDGELNDYINGIICRLTEEHCARVRVHVIRTPSFNATMSPNGYMQVWTGLILRAENEDQLAYVLGHEVGHYLRRHSLQRWRAIRSTTNATTFFQILTAAAGVPVVGQLGSYAALGGLLAYSRDHEREADDVGFELMARARYDVHQAPRIWEALMAERDAEEEPESSVFFATHPSVKERVTTLRTLAQNAVGGGQPLPSSSRHRDMLARFQGEWLGDELRKRKHAANLVLLDRLVRHHINPGVTHFYRGEVYRLRQDAGDDERAVQAYREALAAKDSPVEVHRSLGLVLWRLDQLSSARDAFSAYLEARRDAPDRAMVESYLTRLGG